jgi:hypothetical protein
VLFLRIAGLWRFADSGIGVMELQVAADATMESLVLAILRLFSPCRDDMK